MFIQISYLLSCLISSGRLVTPSQNQFENSNRVVKILISVTYEIYLLVSLEPYWRRLLYCHSKITWLRYDELGDHTYILN